MKDKTILVEPGNPYYPAALMERAAPAFPVYGLLAKKS